MNDGRILINLTKLKRGTENSPSTGVRVDLSDEEAPSPILLVLRIVPRDPAHMSEAATLELLQPTGGVTMRAGGGGKVDGSPANGRACHIPA
jgi:hypothetical protein